jgi:hypothetical protein
MCIFYEIVIKIPSIVPFTQILQIKQKQIGEAKKHKRKSVKQKIERKTFLVSSLNLRSGFGNLRSATTVWREEV